MSDTTVIYLNLLVKIKEELLNKINCQLCSYCLINLNELTLRLEIRTVNMCLRVA